MPRLHQSGEIGGEVVTDNCVKLYLTEVLRCKADKF